MQLFRLIFLLFLIVNTSIGIKVVERLLQLKAGNARCLIGLTKQFEHEGIADSLVSSLVQTAAHATRHLNCTILRVTFTLYKIPDEPNGTYDGFIGMVQRDELDLIDKTIRPDSVPYEPFKLTPVLLPGDMSIITSRKPELELNYDLTKFLDLGTVIYLYLFMTMMFIVPLLYAYSERARSRDEPKTLLSDYIRDCEHVASQLFDQDQFSPKTVAGHLIALSTSLFILFGIHGLLMNTVGADLKVMRVPDIIDSLDDLIASNLKPMVVDNLFAYYILKSSPSGSKEHQLWLKVLKYMPDSIVKIDTTDSQAMLSSVNRVVDEAYARRAAFIGPQFIAQGMHIGSCLASSMDDQTNNIAKFAKSIQIARQGFAKGILTGAMSKKIHPFTERVLSSLMTTALETGLVPGLIQVNQHQFHSIVQVPGLKYGAKTIACLEGKSSTQGQDFQPFPLEDMGKAFQLWLFSSLSAFFILLLEMFFSSLNKQTDRAINRRGNLLRSAPKRARLFVPRYQLPRYQLR